MNRISHVFLCYPWNDEMHQLLKLAPGFPRPIPRSPGWLTVVGCECPWTRRAGRDGKESEHPDWRWQFTEPLNSHMRLVWGSGKRRCLPPHYPDRNLSNLYRGLPGQLSDPSRWSRQHLLLSRLCPWNGWLWAQRVDPTSQGQERREQPSIAWGQLWVNQWSCPLDSFPPPTLPFGPVI